MIKNFPPEHYLTDADLTTEDRELKAIWNCAFPDGLKYRQWSQLIYLMYAIDGKEYPMSMRAVASHVGILLNLKYVYLLNEVYGLNEIEPNQEILDWLRERMQACGYYEWLKRTP